MKAFCGKIASCIFDFVRMPFQNRQKIELILANVEIINSKLNFLLSYCPKCDEKRAEIPFEKGK
jgi:hypothetical protein